MHKVGIMQGRLSPALDNKIQFFPIETWQKEFRLARECGFDMIEWVIDEEISKNPIFTSNGRREILKLKNEFAIDIPSICCDCFMNYSFFSSDSTERIYAKGLLLELISDCVEVGIKYLELPFIGSTEISSSEISNYLAAFFLDIEPCLLNNNISILLETNLKPLDLKKFISNFASTNILLNYDMGNSAYWGFNAEEEFGYYGSKIGNVHVKDCTPSNYSVPLGKGDVNFNLVFSLLKKFQYEKDFILQTARDSDDVAAAIKYLEFTKNLIGKYLK